MASTDTNNTAAAEAVEAILAAALAAEAAGDYSATLELSRLAGVIEPLLPANFLHAWACKHPGKVGEPTFSHGEVLAGAPAEGAWLVYKWAGAATNYQYDNWPLSIPDSVRWSVNGMTGVHDALDAAAAGRQMDALPPTDQVRHARRACFAAARRFLERAF